MKVFGRVLVALDGSKFSERGLELVDSLRCGADTKLSLMRVVTSVDVLEAEQEPAELLDRAASYLAEIRGARQEREVQILVEHSEDPADTILEAAEQHDLIVIMTHGRGGVKRWKWGSVAERVVRHSPVPVLLGNLEGDAAQPSAFERLLVPLDGSETAARAVVLAGRLASALDAEVVLFRASWVEPTDNVMVFAQDVAETRKLLRDELEVHASALRSEGLRARSSVTMSYPADAILNAVEEERADLIVMTTHGRTGLKRWLLGSVAEKVLRASPRPVLLLRAQ